MSQSRDWVIIQIHVRKGVKRKYDTSKLRSGMTGEEFISALLGIPPIKEKEEVEAVYLQRKGLGKVEGQRVG